MLLKFNYQCQIEVIKPDLVLQVFKTQCKLCRSEFTDYTCATKTFRHSHICSKKRLEMTRSSDSLLQPTYTSENVLKIAVERLSQQKKNNLTSSGARNGKILSTPKECKDLLHFERWGLMISLKNDLARKKTATGNKKSALLEAYHVKAC